MRERESKNLKKASMEVEKGDDTDTDESNFGIEEFKCLEDMSDHIEPGEGHDEKVQTKAIANIKKTEKCISKATIAWKILHAIRSTGESEATVHFIKRHIIKCEPKYFSSMHNKRFKSAVQRLVKDGLVESNRFRIRLLENESQSSGKSEPKGHPNSSGTQILDKNNATEQREKIMTIFKKKKTCTRQSIAKEVGINASLCSFLLSGLQNDGFISREGRHTYLLKKGSEKRDQGMNKSVDNALKDRLKKVFIKLKKTIDSLGNIIAEMED